MGEGRGIPHLAKNERDVGHPFIIVRDRVMKVACAHISKNLGKQSQVSIR